MAKLGMETGEVCCLVDPKRGLRLFLDPAQDHILRRVEVFPTFFNGLDLRCAQMFTSCSKQYQRSLGVYFF